MKSLANESCQPERSEVQRTGVERFRRVSQPLERREGYAQQPPRIPRLRCTPLGMTVVAGLLGLAITGRAFAIAGIDTPPTPSAPHETKFAEPQETTLANGLRVIVAERHRLPLLAASVVIRHGAEVDPPDRAGAAALVGDLLTKGTATMSAPEIATAIESLGGTIDSGAGWDQSAAGIVVMSDKADVALKILADVVRRPAFKQEEIDRLKAQRLDALRVALQQPGSLAKLVTGRAVFGASPYGHAASGTLESLAAIQRDDIVHLYQNSYAPNAATFVLAGDVTLEQAKGFAEKYFGDWKAGEAAPDAAPPAEAGWKPRNIVIDMPEAGQAAVTVARPAIKRAAPDYYPALVANAAFGSGFVSRLNREIRIKRGLSYGAGSALSPRREVGPFSAAAQTKNESAAEVAGLMQSELKRLVSEPVKGNELRSRQAVLTGGYARNLETNQGFVAQISDLATYDLPLDTLDKFIPTVNSVTTEAVTEFAKKYLDQPTSVVIAGKASAFLAPLKKKVGAVTVIEQKNLDLNRADLTKTKELTKEHGGQ